MKTPAILLFGLTLLAGCQSYEIVQRAVFSDDDGSYVRVDYGRASSDHVNTFVSPVNGKKLDFKSRLVICVTLPNDESFTAWQCMNFNSMGTMYKTDNEQWMAQMNGFTCMVYRREEDGRYREVYRGVLCDTPALEGKRRDKSYVVKPPDQSFKPKE